MSLSNDAYAPDQIAGRVRDSGVVKARRDVASVFALAVLAGAFIALGGLFYTVVVTGSGLGFGATRLLGGVAFSLGLILVVIAGAELFTGNNLAAMAWASRLISSRELMRNWVIVYVGNFVGSVATAALVTMTGVHTFGQGAVESTLSSIWTHKTDLDPLRAIALGILCNALVCLAVWLSMAARSVSDKVLAVVFPITAFVAIGLEHSVANMFFFAWHLGVQGVSGAPLAAASTNLLFVTIGNIVGGSLLVAGVYWFVYLRKREE